MIIKTARLCDFRNVAFSQADLNAQSVWIYGLNAQGKTNLLEALGLLGAMRSFRTAKLVNLIRYESARAQALFEISHETLGEVQVMFEISSKTRKIFIDDVEQKLGDFIGKFPVLSVSSDDIKLVRGAPLERRKFADILISSLDNAYFESLRAYHAALENRNALLRQEKSDPLSFEFFERSMAIGALEINQKRAHYFSKLGQIATQKYEILAGNRETAEIRLKASRAAESSEEYLKLLQQSRAKDAILGSTSAGPHRDDFSISISSESARDFASEGQQRSIALSLRLAQYEMYKEKSSALPVLLCDDILGELDPRRRSAFWSSVDSRAQVIATSTLDAPSDSCARADWLLVKVENGIFLKE